MKKIVNHYSVLGKGLIYDSMEGTNSYQYITKRFTGTLEEFNKFADSLEDLNEIERGLDKDQTFMCDNPKPTQAYKSLQMWKRMQEEANRAKARSKRKFRHSF